MTTPLTKLIAENKMRPIEARTNYDDQPARQIIRLSGASTHSGASWAREVIGEACISTKTKEGYSEEDLKRLCLIGDIDRKSVSITHFRPLPDDRLARVTEVLLEALNEISETTSYDAYADRTGLTLEAQTAMEAITKAEAIAEGKE